MERKKRNELTSSCYEYKMVVWSRLNCPQYENGMRQKIFIYIKLRVLIFVHIKCNVSSMPAFHAIESPGYSEKILTYVLANAQNTVR